MMRDFVSGEQRGKLWISYVEWMVRDGFGGREVRDELGFALASYEPEGGPYLVDTAEVVRLLDAALPKVTAYLASLESSNGSEPAGA